MNEDIEIKQLKKTISDQDKQIISLRKALEIVNQKVNLLAKKQGHISDNVRRASNDINTIKLKLSK